MTTLMTTVSVGEINGGKATTQLVGWPFNSMCRFEGRYLGMSTGGLYEIGESDAMSKPASYFQTFKMKLGWDALKRLRNITLGVQCEGDLKITVFADDTQVQVIEVYPQRDGIQYIKIPISEEYVTDRFNSEGLGYLGHGMYFHFLVENVSGSWFSIDIMKTKVVNLNKGRMK